MKHFKAIFICLQVIWNQLSFGITRFMRVLVKKKILKSRYSIDIDNDGKVDIVVNIADQKGDQYNDN